MESGECILIGGSVRAAAFSALCAGLTPHGIDLFADADLCDVAEARRIPFADYPQRFPHLLRDAPAGPVIYTGGLENHPRLIDRIAAERPVWGNDATALQRARDPFQLARLLRANGLPCPEIARLSQPGGAAMVRKPLRGAGGAHIAIAEPGAPAARSFYYQQFISGPSFAATFCAGADRAILLGVTEQLVGAPWLNAKPFHYCGSIGPVELSAALVETLMRLGEALRVGCGLRGLFGVDFILNGGQPWPVEVNPRYTASIEVLEYATGLRAMVHHRGAFDPTWIAACDVAPGAKPPATTQVGKAILFAPRRFMLPERGPWTRETDFSQRPDFADVPHAGEIIEEGWPILSIFTEAPTREECHAKLRQRALETLRILPV